MVNSEIKNCTSRRRYEVYSKYVRKRFRSVK